MRFVHLILILILTSGMAGGQNLFPNGGFEQFDTCPTYTSQINRSTDWDSCLGTADFFHCGFYLPTTVGTYGIPASGAGVVGLAASVPGPWSPDPNYFYGETFRGNLLSSLLPGATYELKADLLYNTVQATPPDDCLDVGFYFFKSTNPPVYPASPPFTNQYQAQVGLAANLVPVGSYGTFTFSYTADSCYDAVMIGLFSNNNTFGNNCFTNGSGTFYFDIDNISMLKISDAPLRTTAAVSNTTSICKAESVDFQGTSNLTVNNWSWNFSGAANGSSPLQNPTGIIYPNPGTYDVTLITEFECDRDTLYLEKYINVKDIPLLKLEYDSSSQCFGTPVEIAATSNETVIWNNGLSGNTISVGLPGIYIATATNECGTARDTVTITFENCPCEIFLPNAFTPDANGNNDLFKAEGVCELRDFQLEIFDRWGQRIYFTNNINDGWDGSLNGAICPQGIYTATLSWSGYSDQKVKRVRKNSMVALLR